MEKQIQKRIKEWRRYLVMNQRDFSEIAKVKDWRSVSRWENGKASPSYRSIRNIIKYIGIDYETFMCGPEDLREERELYRRLDKIEQDIAELKYLLQKLIKDDTI